MAISPWADRNRFFETPKQEGAPSLNRITSTIVHASVINRLGKIEESLDKVGYVRPNTEHERNARGAIATCKAIIGNTINPSANTATPPAPQDDDVSEEEKGNTRSFK